MDGSDTGGGGRGIVAWSQVGFAATLVSLGFVGLWKGDLVALWLPVPPGIPARRALVVVTALVPSICGIGLLGRRFAAPASRVLLGYLLAWLVLVNGIPLVRHLGTPTAWAAARTATLAAAAWVLCVWSADRGEAAPVAFVAGDMGLRFGRSLYGLALIPFGVAHFTYLERTVGMVPAWLPWHLAWAYFFGCTFIAAGIAVLLDVRARLAAALSVAQMGMFTVLVWVPVVVSGPGASDWREFVTSWMLTAAGWVVADSYR